MKAVARPQGKPAARAHDAWDLRPDGTDRARGREKLGGERRAVLDAARLEPRVGPPDFGARGGRREGHREQGGDPEHGSDPVPMHRGKIRGFVACVERPTPPWPKGAVSTVRRAPQIRAGRGGRSTGLDGPPGLRLNA